LTSPSRRTATKPRGHRQHRLPAALPPAPRTAHPIRALTRSRAHSPRHAPYHQAHRRRRCTRCTRYPSPRCRPSSRRRRCASACTRGHGITPR
jgi:hypothetical protein